MDMEAAGSARAAAVRILPFSFRRRAGGAASRLAGHLRPKPFPSAEQEPWR